MEIFYDGTFLDRVIIVICLVGALIGGTFAVYSIGAIAGWIRDGLRKSID